MLADYCIALLKKEDKTVAQLQEYCIENLNDFLTANTLEFVEQVFAVVQSGSYLSQGDTEQEREAEEREREGVQGVCQ